MVKNYFLTIFAGIAFLGLLASCNTTADPTESIPNPDDGPPPKRILTKVTANSVSQEEYTTTSGVLEQAVVKNDAASNVYYTGTITYNNKTIKKINFVSSASTGMMKYDFDMTSDSKGNIYNASCVATASTSGASYVSDYIFTYDASGKLTKILEKRKTGGISAYNGFIENAFDYSAENISQVKVSKGLLKINGDPDMSTAVLSQYSFQNYDAQKSPYSTLPKAFFIIRGLMDPVNFYKASPNNPTSMYIKLPDPAPGVNTAQSYSYDNQGYPVIEKNQNVTFAYKNL
ncbi:hypothetical protein [Chryseobacterium sp. PMSZPI]|uniref:hypothetical protein n=1 Tax=Chryseobacterium sp. PMSZPI TaxID=1033900 RepID=UPI000C33FFFD|nr:hypothetical protein [Chryseobacterium sp. PMSZPI]PKF75415.1 hypothetical protein CW752_04230 [Chryseobacterium sp. PMSZPI]